MDTVGPESDRGRHLAVIESHDARNDLLGLSASPIRFTHWQMEWIMNHLEEGALGGPVLADI
jgi:hypothetical protein